jgi:hypothetical protein
MPQTVGVSERETGEITPVIGSLFEVRMERAMLDRLSTQLMSRPQL